MKILPEYEKNILKRYLCLNCREPGVWEHVLLFSLGADHVQARVLISWCDASLGGALDWQAMSELPPPDLPRNAGFRESYAYRKQLWLYGDTQGTGSGWRWQHCRCKNLSTSWLFSALYQPSSAFLLQRVNDMTGSINLEETLKKAEAMYLQLRNCRDLPCSVREIIGLPEGLPLPNGMLQQSTDSTPSSPERLRLSLGDRLQRSAAANGQHEFSTTPDDSSIEILPEQTEMAL